jgi:hypothetical protein
LDHRGSAEWAKPPIAPNVPLSWKGDIQGDVTLRLPVPPRGALDQEAVVMRSCRPAAYRAVGNLDPHLPQLLEGDIAGDMRWASSPWRSALDWPVPARSDTDHVSRETEGK